jgi:hypothetical protein
MKKWRVTNLRGIALMITLTMTKKPIPNHNLYLNCRQDMAKEALVSAMKARHQSSFASLAMVCALTFVLNQSLRITLALLPDPYLRTTTTGAPQVLWRST